MNKGTQRATALIPDLSPEAAYASVATDVHRKKFGQYFTPHSLSSLMANWALAHSPKTILDPAVGTGALIRACLNQGANARIVAYEKDPQIIQFCDVPADRVELRNEDFLLSDLSQTFDAVVMNPPYVRHREFEGYEDVRADLSLRSRHVMPASANMYIYFSVKAILSLSAGGRAALLIPTEWMNANFSASFKKFLLKEDLLREIVLFSGCSNVFEDALTTASILFIEKPK